MGWGTTREQSGVVSVSLFVFLFSGFFWSAVVVPLRKRLQWSHNVLCLRCVLAHNVVAFVFSPCGRSDPFLIVLFLVFCVCSVHMTPVKYGMTIPVTDTLTAAAATMLLSADHLRVFRVLGIQH